MGWIEREEQNISIQNLIQISLTLSVDLCYVTSFFARVKKTSAKLNDK